MRRIDKFRDKRKDIATTEYKIFERLNDLSDQIDTLTKRLDDLYEHLYYCNKFDKEEYANAFDEQFKESVEALTKIEELENIIYWRETK